MQQVSLDESLLCFFWGAAPPLVSTHSSSTWPQNLLSETVTNDRAIVGSSISLKSNEVASSAFGLLLVVMPSGTRWRTSLSTASRSLAVFVFQPPVLSSAAAKF